MQQIHRRIAVTYPFQYSPNNSSRKGHDVEGIVLHFTGGGNLDGTVKWLCSSAAEASAHYVVSRSGNIVQLVKEDRAAWHAGSPSTTPILNGKKNLNKRTIGIEICNWGWLYKAKTDEIVVLNSGEKRTRKEEQLYVRRKKWTTKYKGPNPHIYHVLIKDSKALQYMKKYRNWPGGNITWWETYPEIQMTNVQRLVKEIVDRYPHITKEWIATHADVDPTRKLDMVGNVFNFQSIIDYVFPEKETAENYRTGKLDQEEYSTEEDMKEMYEKRTNKTNKIWCL